MKKIVFLILLDQITKFLAFRGFFDFCSCLRLTKNYGLIFSISFRPYDWLVLVLIFGLLVWYFFVFRAPLEFKSFYFLLIFSGAISNLFDRISFGYVRDFINLGLATVNLADFYLLLGVLWSLLDSKHLKQQ